jgi:membrane-associated phospholipid phosphatase
MQSQLRHEYGGNTPQEGSKKGPQGTVGLHFPWHRSVPRDDLLLMASAGQFALFAPLAWWAHKHPQPPVEVGIIHVVQKKQSRSLQAAARVLSTIAGSAVLMNILVVPTALLLWKRHLRLEAVMTVGISWTSALVRMLIQRMVDRPRPSPLFVHITKQKRSKSFPSGHVAASLDFWGWLFALGIIMSKGTRPWQKGLLGLPALCVVLIGPSRIYLGDHWSTDVLGGYLFGSGWLGMSLRLYLALRRKNVWGAG